MPACYVKGCKNRTEFLKKHNLQGNVHFYAFPKDKQFFEKWKKACGRENVNIKNAKVCSDHFSPTAFKEKTWLQKQLPFSPTRGRRLKDDAVPTVKLPEASARPSSCTGTIIEKSLCTPIVSLSPRVDNVISEDMEKSLTELSAIKGTMWPQEKPSTFEIQSNRSQEDTVLSENLMKRTINSIHAINFEVQNVSPMNAENLPPILNETFHEREEHFSEDNCLWKKKYEKVKKDNIILQRKLRIKEKKIIKADHTVQKYTGILKKLFTPGQINLLLHPEKTKTKWNAEDISAAISLRSVSAKAYRFLRNTLQIPLPSFSTLRKWVDQLDMEQGILYDVLSIMKQQGSKMTNIEKLTVLCFDEVYISSLIDIDRKKEQKIGPHKTCQFIMTRGLFGKWKQPVFYHFDQPITKSILFDVITKLHESGYTVVATTSDMGPSNQKLWNTELNIGTGTDQNCYFLHPCDERLRVHVFIDPPHLIKLARNHYLDKGFVFQQRHLRKLCLEELLRLNTNTDLKIGFKLTRRHLECRGTERQKVKLATQLFSNTNAMAVKACGEKGFDGFENWSEVSFMLQLFNNWFDVLNSKAKFGSYSESGAFGIEYDKQLKVLQDMDDFISNMRVYGCKTLLPFQKGIKLCNTSLPALLMYLKKTYNNDDFKIQYLLTNRLNQDVLENCFSYLRGMGGQNDHPTALNIRHRLRWFIMGKHSTDLFSVNTNTEVHSKDKDIINMCGNCDSSATSLQRSSCNSSSAISRNIDSSQNTTPDVLLTSTLSCIPSTFDGVNDTEMKFPEALSLSNEFKHAESDCDFRAEEFDSQGYTPTAEELQLLKAVEDEDARKWIADEGLKYICGYVAFRFKTKYNFLGTETRKLVPNESVEWIQIMSRGGLMYPSDELLKAAYEMNEKFQEFHGSTLSNETYIFQKVANLVSKKIKNDIPLDVLLCLVRTRTYIRLRELNKKIFDDSRNKNSQRKIYKMSNKKY